MFNRIILEDAFGHRYRMVSHRESAQFRHLTPISFTDGDSAHRFLRKLRVSPDRWQRIASNFDCSIRQPSNRSLGPLVTVSQRLARRQLRLFALAETPPGDTSAAKCAFRQENGELLRFMPVSALLTLPSSAPQRFASEQAASRFLNQLAPDHEQLQELAESLAVPETPLPGAQIAREPFAQLKANLAKMLEQGQVIVVKSKPYLPPPEAGGDSGVSPSALPGHRPVALAPVTVPKPTFIETRLIDDDGEPVADALVWVQDSEGKEFTSKTGPDGVARVSGVAPGQCAISFPELDGWAPA